MSEFLLQLCWFGQFGNRMHQYAYGATYARLTGLQFWLPSDWEGTKLFRRQLHRPVEHDDIRRDLSTEEGLLSSQRLNSLYAASNQKRLQAVRKHFPDAQLIDVDTAHEPYSRPGHPLCYANLCAFNPVLFTRMSRSHLKTVFEFSDEVTRLEAYKRYSDIQGLYDVAHLRRDDISNVEYNRNNRQEYSVVSKDSYFQAFRKFGYSEDSIQWVSDDYTGKWHVGRKMRFRGGWEYPTGSQYLPGIIFDWLNDFLKLYFARTIFRANSSFSWWAAALSPTAKVFSPVIDKRHIYGVDGMEEITVDFVEGNHPHWQYGKPDIVLVD
jgi:hypothetical protein